MINGHDEWRDLVAAYALDAVDHDEAARIEDHLRGCPRCRSELAAHRETAAMLALGGAEAPAGVWERIAGDIAVPPPAPALSLLAGGRSKGRPWRWVLPPVAAVAAAAIVVLSVVVAGQDGRLNRVNAALAHQTLLQQAVVASLDPASRRLGLVSSAGRPEAAVLLEPDGSGYVVATRLPSLPANRTYQLWSIVGSDAVSAGILGPAPAVSAFRSAPGTTALAVTDEPAGGSPRPTSAPVASVSV